MFHLHSGSLLPFCDFLDPKGSLSFSLSPPLSLPLSLPLFLSLSLSSSRSLCITYHPFNLDRLKSFSQENLVSLWKIEVNGFDFRVAWSKRRRCNLTENCNFFHCLVSFPVQMLVKKGQFFFAGECRIFSFVTNPSVSVDVTSRCCSHQVDWHHGERILFYGLAVIIAVANNDV